MATVATRAALLIPISVCNTFACPNIIIMVRLPLFGFLTSPQLLTHATAHGGCRDTVREENSSSRRSSSSSSSSSSGQYKVNEIQKQNCDFGSQVPVSFISELENDRSFRS